MQQKMSVGEGWDGLYILFILSKQWIKSEREKLDQTIHF